jgi:hypothetical protein
MLSDLESRLDVNLWRYEERWGRDDKDAPPSARFYKLVQRAYTTSGKRVVVIINFVIKLRITALISVILELFDGVGKRDQLQEKPV